MTADTEDAVPQPLPATQPAPEADPQKPPGSVAPADTNAGNKENMSWRQSSDLPQRQRIINSIM
jgi:hypothetical protein